MSQATQIRRDVGPWALMFTGLGSIIGSGWLFGAWRAAQIAGPGAIWPDLRTLLAWLVVGLRVSLRTFRWDRAA